jgi:superfamily II DNA or RNA helicase
MEPTIIKSFQSYNSKNLSNTKKTKLQKEQKVKMIELSNEYKNIICSQSYLGKKGYTIAKSILSKEDEEFLKKDLFLKPEILGGMGPVVSDTEISFPVYRESSNKIYIPRFYGIERYGLPLKCEIDCGIDIDVEFAKELRDYQNNIVDVYIQHVKRPIVNGSNNNGSGGILEVHTGAGKTVMALKIITILKKKTLILVHKEFLMNQWIERITEFIPNARVGKIQGSLLDVDNKDIVIGMIQSMYEKDFPNDLFSQFGLTIIDEVHRIGSEQFSKTLFKTITPYMLGISATVDRKDKLTKLLYMFIGPKIYNSERKNGDLVCVRAIDYISNERDLEFRETEYDFRGKPQYSKMIVKLCQYGPRSDFILKVIKDLIEEHPNNQIMILAHNRSLLTYLYDAIQYHNLTTVGYYLGGMKQSELQKTEKQQIVIATYAMAAEALDIKTLSTLIMVTPKTDIIQSVGRILRTKHENPIIVDIIDTHDLFQNQWRQRFTFYKKCNYRVRRIKSTEYKNMLIDWDNDRTWRQLNDYSNQCNDNMKTQNKNNINYSVLHHNDDSNIIVPHGKCLITLE